MELLFWTAVLGVFYPYLGYPAVLFILGRLRARPRPIAAERLPTISLIIPVHNEAVRLEAKIANTLALTYPPDLLEVLFVSDGSTDNTVPLLSAVNVPHVSVLELPTRGGKATALNAGLARARHEILVFTDASILLEPDALQRIVMPLGDPEIGCVSGEDRIAESGGEAWYGRYELLLRKLESRLHSIVGASGSFYAQRRVLCTRFADGMAPDFLSVLRTVELGCRAVTETTAVGRMTSVKDPRHEFERKVRTSIRGLTTLFAYRHMLKPLRYGWFAFALWSHKLLRWLAPLLLVVALLASLALIRSPFYAAAFAAQVLAYLIALGALAGWAGLDRSLPGKVALYFATVNAALLVAWWKYGRGVRQDLWTPSSR